MRMNLTKDRQGFLEDVTSMTLPQLKDLLERQNKILSKKKFVANLPDKGEKSRQFAEKLKQLIAARGGGRAGPNNLDLLHEKNQRLADERSEGIDDEDSTIIDTLVTRNEAEVMYSSETNESMDTNFAEDFSQRLEAMSVGSKPVTDTQHLHPINSYERVIKKVEENPSSAKHKFLPHRSKKDKGPSDLPTSGTNPRPTKVREESAVFPPTYCYESTKLISIEESVQLIEEQREKAEQIAAERAAQRLAEHFTPKMNPYQPPDVDMRYRHAKMGDDDDDDGNDDKDDEDDNYNNNDDDIDSDDVPTDDDDDNGL